MPAAGPADGRRWGSHDGRDHVFSVCVYCVRRCMCTADSQLGLHTLSRALQPRPRRLSLRLGPVVEPMLMGTA